MIQRSRLSNRNTYLRLAFWVISGVKFSFMGLKNEILQFDNEYRAIQCIWMGFVSVNGNITVEWPEFNEKRRFYFVIQDTRRWNESWRKDVASNGRGMGEEPLDETLIVCCLVTMARRTIHFSSPIPTVDTKNLPAIRNDNSRRSSALLDCTS